MLSLNERSWSLSDLHKGSLNTVEDSELRNISKMNLLVSEALKMIGM